MNRAVLLAALLALAPHADARGGSRAPGPPPPPPLKAADAAASTGAFACDLYRQLAGREGNLFFSPASLTFALGMLGVGARGETAAELAGVCGWPADLRAVHPALHDLAAAIRPGDPECVTWRSANRLWGQDGFRLLPSYLADVERWYRGGYAAVDYRRDAERARHTINDWVARQTEDRIRDLLPPGTVDAETRLVLTNAVYFLADWAHAFDPSLTREEPFHLAGGGQRPVPLMSREGRIPYAEVELAGTLLQIAELTYAGGDFGMVVLLPATPDGLPAVERRLDAATLDGWLAGLAPRPVVCRLPRLTLTDQFFLRDTLAAMGLRTVFTARADLSGITGRRDLFVSDVVHKAFLKVDEQGTEAAAATGIVMKMTSAPPPVKPVEFRADRPFLLLIRHKPTGAILFLGRVVDPGA